MSTVLFFDYAKEDRVLAGIDSLFLESGIKRLASKGSVAVKVHMGELGNITYLRPIFVRKVVELIKEAGGYPFVTDTTSLYPKNRFRASHYLRTAAAHGFSKKTMGAPIVIADGESGHDGVEVKVRRRVDGCELRTIKVASAIARADAMVVLSHVKGHGQSGLGGAIKNVAMGCVTKEGKADQHTPTMPFLDMSKCDGCGICVKTCPFDALVLMGGKAIRDLSKCVHCSFCLFECSRGAWSWLEGAKEQFQVYLAHAASAVLKVFKRGRVAFLNFIQDVTPLCDCCTPAGIPVVQDVGILASLDPVAIDMASIDLVDKARIISKLARPPDLLGKINGTDSLVQLRTGQKLGLGSLKYKLVRV